VVSLRSDHLVTIFDVRGGLVRSFGDISGATGIASQNQFLNRGRGSGDSDGHLYFAFTDADRSDRMIRSVPFLREYWDGFLTRPCPPFGHELQKTSGQRRVGPGNLTPSPSQNSGLEPLDSSGSCHPLRAAALRQNRRAPPVASWPIMVPTWIACPLRSTDITPLQRYYQAVRPSASHPYARPRGSIHLWLLRLHRCQGSHVPYARLF
jgi:hypothetical protein